MLESEKMLNFDVSYDEPLKAKSRKVLPFPSLSKNRVAYQTLLAVAMILIVISIGLGVFKNYIPIAPAGKQYKTEEILYRFVYYNPHAKSVAVMGSFTGWKKVYMKRVDGTGYWQLYIKLPKNGLYKYNFVVGKNKIIHDPSNPARIYNGFSGFDSVIKI